ncbi:hypothetical protein GW7_05937 [Heterocephalus glaber]|uniref:Uncharacterized protein n=1 Tax=Heterocephalus glaber TaxID=10181 RepID=G5AQW6_HETGA|nr:hypothetical protein GW7_05937 [Heterocephalus glaber]
MSSLGYSGPRSEDQEPEGAQSAWHRAQSVGSGWAGIVPSCVSPSSPRPFLRLRTADPQPPAPTGSRARVLRALGPAASAPCPAPGNCAAPALRSGLWGHHSGSSAQRWLRALGCTLSMLQYHFSEGVGSSIASFRLERR